MKISNKVKSVLESVYYDGFLNSTKEQRKKAKDKFKHFLDFVEVEQDGRKK